MHTYNATIRWARGDDPFANQKYSRGHHWEFDEGVTVPASASPHTVSAPWSVTSAVDPEEALVAALSSCHMLFFLSDASRGGFIVDRYDDPAVGEMAKNSDGRFAVTKVTIRPRVTFGGTPPSAEEFAALHESAHKQCFISNSVRSEVVIEPVLVKA